MMMMMNERSKPYHLTYILRRTPAHLFTEWQLSSDEFAAESENSPQRHWDRNNGQTDGR